jgi:hypothetical protein
MNLLKKNDLIQLCKSNKISGYSSLNKDQLIKLIKKGGTNPSQNKVNIDITDLRDYIKKLKLTNKQCIKNNSCKIRTGSKAQSIEICNKNVIKGALSNKSKERIEKVNKNTIKLDPITMNLLIQSVTNKLVEDKFIKSHRIEHYSNLCKNNKLKLVSNKANYHDYPTLEDYIIKSNDNNVNKINMIVHCLDQAFETLDILYNKIQFHHCDPKCAQLFLFNYNNSKCTSDTNRDENLNLCISKSNNNNESKIYPTCMLGDLDKVTFTLNINDSPYRIRTTKDFKKYTVKGITLSIGKKINFMNKITQMRFDSLPKSNNSYEKCIFISSACLLLDNFDDAIILRNRMLKKIFKNINNNDYNNIIILNKNKYKKMNKNKRKSVVPATAIVNYNFFKNNNSYKIVSLRSYIDLNQLSYYKDQI